MFIALLYDLINVDQTLDDTAPNKYNKHQPNKKINYDNLGYNYVKQLYPQFKWDALDTLDADDKTRYLEHFLFGPNDKFQSVTAFEGIIVNSILNLC